ncbi:MAG: hypothetical protein WCK89_18660, partial [bacterium]
MKEWQEKCESRLKHFGLSRLGNHMKKLAGIVLAAGILALVGENTAQAITNKVVAINFTGYGEQSYDTYAQQNVSGSP